MSEGIATITFNRPESLNSLTPAMFRRYTALLHRADRDSRVRVVVLTGAGRGFCSGADLAAMESVSEDGLDSLVPPPGDGPDLVSALRIPVLAAVNGPAAGIGLAIALSADLRYVAGDAKLALPFARLGLVAEYGVAWTLPRLVGFGTACDLLLTGRVFSGEEAVRMGLASKAFRSSEVLPEVRAVAASIARMCSPVAVTQIRQLLYAGQEKGLAEAYAQSIPLIRATAGSADLGEGVAAILAKRSPNFAPRDAAM
ncbi:enoyl-CoA hydratase-related protein [Nocardia sp. NPDC004123]